MSWIHCNKCFLKDQNFNEILFLQCGHLLCRKCISKKCLICYKTTKYVTLPKKEIMPTMDLYFQNPINYGKKLLSILKFQFENRINLEVEGAKLFKKIKQVKENCQKVDQEIKNAQEEMRKEYLRIKKMKVFIEQTKMYKNVRKSNKDGSQDSGVHGIQTSYNTLQDTSFLLPSTVD
ncbi:RING finger protein 212B [Condylostylus longicornis]|uniref:RING finger protein 212B n=1 Tax=Condylostylus longicornis TaxID=2530218 RepID=UPI00244DDD73|nr:RING finger protein 212B [Condylostylus longicornis]